MPEAQPTVRHYSAPVRVRRSTETRSGLPVRRVAPDFVYVVYEKGWSYHDECGWLPELRTISAMPGANGVTDKGDITGAIAGAMKKGGIVIDPEDARLGDPEAVDFFEGGPGFRWYVCTYDTDRMTRQGTPVKHHVAWCQQATKLKSGEVLWNGDSPELRKEWTRFRRFLRDREIVPPMQHEVYVLKMAVERDKLERLEMRYAAQPAMAPKIEEHHARMRAMEAAWGTMRETGAEPSRAVAPTRKAAETGDGLGVVKPARGPREA